MERLGLEESHGEAVEIAAAAAPEPKRRKPESECQGMFRDTLSRGACWHEVNERQASKLFFPTCWSVAVPLSR